MRILPVETSSLVTLNMLLLFLVAIEPYLLNILISGGVGVQGAVGGPVSQIYAVDLGSMYVILAYFIHQALAQEKKLHRTRHLKRFGRERAFVLIVASAFYVSILPFFAGPEFYGFTARQFLWLVFIPIGFVMRVVGMFEARHSVN